MAGKSNQRGRDRKAAARKPKTRAGIDKSPAPPAKGDVFVLMITLLGSKPPIWRRFAVPADLRLDRLHDVIQTVMGWTDSHLHQFIMHGTQGSQRRRITDAIYFMPQHAPDGYPLDQEFDRDLRDTAETRVCDLLKKPKDRIVYEYDFGDGWEHGIELEQIIPASSPDAPSLPQGKRALPAVCIEGKLACPPDDCGGIWRYYDMLEAIKDPKHEMHEDLVEWLDDGFDAEAFDLEAVNKSLRRSRR
jgi:hypothetical protein